MCQPTPQIQYFVYSLFRLISPECASHIYSFLLSDLNATLVVASIHIVIIGKTPQCFHLTVKNLSALRFPDFFLVSLPIKNFL